MKHFQITTATGENMGIFEGETEEGALDAMARDAGYRDQAHVIAIGVSPFVGTVEEVDGRYTINGICDMCDERGSVAPYGPDCVVCEDCAGQGETDGEIEWDEEGLKWIDKGSV